MNDEGDFLAAIIAQPEDDTVRLVFADWLQEHGQPERAEFIRLQIRQARTPPDSPEHIGAANRAHALYHAHHRAWLVGQPRDLVSGLDYNHFERGFVATLRRTAVGLLRLPKRAWAEHPIRELIVSQFGGRLDRVLALPSLARIRKLSLLTDRSGYEGHDRPSGAVVPSDCEALANCPHLTGVRDLGCTYFGNDLVAALARCSSLRGVTSLSMNGGDVDDDGVAVLTTTGGANLHALRSLSLRLRRTGVGVAVALAHASALSALETLHLGGDWGGRIGDAGVTALARSPHLARLRALHLHLQRIGPDGARALADTPHLTGLRSLIIRFSPLGPTGAEALINGPWTELSRLDLESNGLGDAGAAALAGAGRLVGLTELRLEKNRIGPAGAGALSRANWPRGLATLDLRNNPIGDEGARALCESASLGATKVLVSTLAGHLSPACAATVKQRFGEVWH